jgi:tRNA (mo5U34)-methyltransferase
MQIKWRHSIVLSNGTITPGEEKDTQQRLKEFPWPDVTGKSVLDIGTWDGAFAFEAEKRGASKVVANDWDVWNSPNGDAGFKFAHDDLQSHVLPYKCSIYDITPQLHVDIVLFLGVLYHLRHPLLGLDKIYNILNPGGVLVLETHCDLCPFGRSAIAVYPNGESNDDVTTYWGPNGAAIIDLLTISHFTDIKMMQLLPSPYSVRGTNKGDYCRGIFYATKNA